MKKVTILICLFIFQFGLAQNDSIILVSDTFSYITFSKNEKELNSENKLILDQIISSFEPYKSDLNNYILIKINFNSRENSKYIYSRLNYIFLYFENHGYNRNQFIIKMQKMNKYEKISAYSFTRYKRC